MLSGKRPAGCSSAEQRTSEDEEERQITYTIEKPFHIRLLDHQNRIRQNNFSCCSVIYKHSKSTLRVRNYWRKVKSYKKYIVSAILQKDFDIRPYTNIRFGNRTHVALLDSGANKSVIGGQLAKEILNYECFRKYLGRVKTADGKVQNVSGSVVLDIEFQNITKPFEFLVVPNIKQDIICGMDFWNLFGIKISTNFCISEVDSNDPFVNPLTVDQKRKLDAAIAAFPSSDIEGLGCTDLIEHHIDTGEATPIKQRHYPISPAMEKILCTELDRMLSLGVIEEATGSPWSSPTVLIVKPGKVRCCLDSRKLNSVTTKDAYPIPNIDGLLSRLPPVHWITKIDLKDAFWQIKLDPRSRPKTAFAVPNRPLYQFTRMPFGLCNAPQTLCRLMDKVIPYYLKSRVFVYLDDLLIVSQTFEEHLNHLYEVATQLRKAGLTINVGKSNFGLNQVKYLGYVVGKGTLEADKEKVSAIVDYPVPKTIRQLRRFLGMTGWYRRFIHNYADVTHPLTDLLSSKRKFCWNQEAQKSFDLLKEKLTTAPLLVHPNYSKPFILQCDASTYGVGAVLAQEDDEGIERPISFMSQKLNKAQRNYTVTELECLAVLLAIKKYRAYIEGHPFKVITDHASLKWLMSQKDLQGRLARWAMKIQGFNFTIEHRRGRDNVVPDALSRITEGDLACVNEVVTEVLPSIDLNSTHFNSEEYANLRQQYQNSNLPDFTVIDKYIYKRTNFSDGSNDDTVWKLLIPTELRRNVIYAAHDVPNSAHGGIAKTIERIRRHFFWPGLVTDVRNYIQNCNLCRTSKPPTKILRPSMGQMVETERPFQRIYLDFIGPFPRSKKGNIGILIALDHFSKFPFLKPVRKMTSKCVMEFLKNDIFDCFGVPETVVTDNGQQFKSKEFENFLCKYGVKHVCTAVYSPQSNASERVNRSVNEALRSYIRDDQREWDVYISSINCALRNSLHQSLGQTPYQIVFGQTMLTHGEDYKLLRNLNLLKEYDSKLERDDEFTLIRDRIKSYMKGAYDKNAKYYNLRSRERKFEIGQEVVHRNFKQSSQIQNFNSKLGPVGIRSIVKRKLGNHYYELEDLDTKNTSIFHAKDIW